MIEHNKKQTLEQKAKRRMLAGSAQIFEMVMVQNDPSYSTMTKLIKLVAGCDAFSLLSRLRSYRKNYTLDIEALVGDPLNTETDQEATLILNQYGLNDLAGASGKLLARLSSGDLPLLRQLVSSEDYTTTMPQLAIQSTKEKQDRLKVPLAGLRLCLKRKNPKLQDHLGLLHQKIRISKR